MFSSAVWLKVPVDFCHYISIAAHYGFKFHHTQPKYVMMSLWLPEDVPNKIPEFGTHHLGVAGRSTACGGRKRYYCGRIRCKARAGWRNVKCCKSCCMV